MVFTAAKPFDSHSSEAKNLASLGIAAPDETADDDNGHHG